MGAKTYVVGDVHGCLQELELLLAQMDLGADTKVVFAGDLVDKGPQSAEVVRTVRELSARIEVVLVKGNHEEKHERWRRHERRRAEGTPNPIKKGASELAEITAQLTQEDVAFLESAPIFHMMPEHNACVVHGGIPMWMQEPLEDPAKYSNRHRELLMLRAFSKRGGFLSLDKFQALTEEAKASAMWGNHYDGRFGHAYFGHQPWLDGPKRYPNATGIDTGCCHGGALTAVELGTGEEIRVEALEVYAAPFSHHA